jgi:hypothetical protein
VAKDDLPNESMKKDKAMEFNSNKEISVIFAFLMSLRTI